MLRTPMSFKKQLSCFNRSLFTLKSLEKVVEITIEEAVAAAAVSEEVVAAAAAVAEEAESIATALSAASKPRSRLDVAPPVQPTVRCW